MYFIPGALFVERDPVSYEMRGGQARGGVLYTLCGQAWRTCTLPLFTFSLISRRSGAGLSADGLLSDGQNVRVQELRPACPSNSLIIVSRLAIKAGAAASRRASWRRRQRRDTTVG